MSKGWHNGCLLVGDVLEKIKEIPGKSVDCALTSPPYWGLRDYKVSDQWGLEEDFREYLHKLDLLMEEIKRILKDTGTCWINLGDTYSGGYNHSDWEGSDDRFDKRMKENKFQAQQKNHFQAKTRYGIPERFYINCIDNGWIARNHIIWAKSNAMPTSVKDRLQNRWESIFFFAKKGKYFFNLDAIREKPLTAYEEFNRRIRDAKKLKQIGLDGAMPAAKASDKEIEEYGNHQPGERSRFGCGRDITSHMEKAAQRKMLEVPGQTPHGIHRNREEGKPDWDLRKWEQDMGQTTQSIAKNHTGVYNRDTGELIGNLKGKNPGDIFNINPRPFTDAHFATFPEELPTKIIKCAVPEKVCRWCGIPAEDICNCNAGFEPGVVFDPFMGSGTVALTAIKLNRRWLGIELNPDYVEIMRKRLLPTRNEKIDNYA